MSIHFQWSLFYVWLLHVNLFEERILLQQIIQQSPWLGTLCVPGILVRFHLQL